MALVHLQCIPLFLTDNQIGSHLKLCEYPLHLQLFSIPLCDLWAKSATSFCNKVFVCFLVFILFIYFWPCRVACSILVPWPGIEPMPPVVEAPSLNRWITREVPKFFFFNLNLFIYLFTYFQLCWVFVSVRAFSSCGKRGPLFIAVRRPLTIVASLVAEHRLQTRRLGNCGSQA